MKSLPSSMLCAPAREPNARVNPVTSALMRLVVFIDLLVSVVECVGATPTFRECGVMVTRTTCNFFDTNDNQFGYNTRQSAQLSSYSPVLGAVE
jgi:hypothetical protein